VEFDKEHPEIFSFAVLKHVITSTGDSRFSIFHSITCLMDFLVLIAAFGLGIYTMSLAIQTCNFVRNESSLIDYMKFDRWCNSPSKYKAELAWYWAEEAKKRTLSIPEVIDAVFGEKSFNANMFIPKYSDPTTRNLDFVSQQWLAKREGETTSDDSDDKKGK
jgi:hypothetical protein